MSIQEQIKELVSTNNVVLFMKGTRRAPQCGFSARTIEILDEYLAEYETVDVLADAELRQGIKVYAEWPTIPQLYVGGEFVGGCDIVTEMNGGDELAEVLGTSRLEIAEPVIDLTDAAAAALVEYWDGDGKPTIRFHVPPNFEHGLEFGEAQEGDFVIPFETCVLVVDRSSSRRCDGTTIGFVETDGRTGFQIENPQEPPRVRAISAAVLHGWVSEGKPLEFFDVRGADEREIATIEGARAWDDSATAFVESLDPDSVLVFHCHHGGRSLAAAQHWVRRGFREVYNLTGGIDAWSVNVDPEVPRY